MIFFDWENDPVCNAQKQLRYFCIPVQQDIFLLRRKKFGIKRGLSGKKVWHEFWNC